MIFLNSLKLAMILGLLNLPYKQGLVKNNKISAFKDSRFSNWQFSVYIPLSKCLLKK